MLHLKENILLIRTLSGKTQKEFVKEFTKVTVAMLKSYEGGKANPSPLFVEELSHFSGVSMADLLSKQLNKSDISIQGEKVNKVDASQDGTTIYEKASIIIIKQILAKILAKSDDYDKVQSCLNEIEERTNVEMQRLLRQLRNTVS